jgi:hypothetical protein
VASTLQKTKPVSDSDSVERISREEGARLVDEQARRYLKMSSEDFVRKYRAGRITDPHRLDVARVAILLPLVEN